MIIVKNNGYNLFYVAASDNLQFLRISDNGGSVFVNNRGVFDRMVIAEVYNKYTEGKAFTVETSSIHNIIVHDNTPIQIATLVLVAVFYISFIVYAIVMYIKSRRIPTEVKPIVPYSVCAEPSQSRNVPLRQISVK